MQKDKYNKKPLFGLVNSEEGIKISARISDALASSGINLKEILSKTASQLGGQGGGHKAASGATILAGKEEEFIKIVDLELAVTKLENADNNINTKGELVQSKDKIEIQVEKEVETDEVSFQQRYGQAGHQEAGAEGEEKGGEASGEGRDRGSQGKAGEDRVPKKMERKGLVQYFSTPTVRQQGAG